MQTLFPIMWRRAQELYRPTATPWKTTPPPNRRTEDELLRKAAELRVNVREALTNNPLCASIQKSLGVHAMSQIGYTPRGNQTEDEFHAHGSGIMLVISMRVSRRMVQAVGAE